MYRIAFAIGAILLIITACSDSSVFDKMPSGVWRNETAKIDYHFSPDNVATIVGKNSSSECTTEIQSRKPDERTLIINFKCPLPDWPGYVEEHEFIFSDDYKVFVDTTNIQGMKSRIEGDFFRLTP